MTKDQIEQLAKKTLSDHGLLSIPVDPLMVSQVLKIRVLHAQFSEDDKSGVIVCRKGKFSIFINSNDSPSRKRFTIAHEIGHRLLHMEANKDSELIDKPDNFRITLAPAEWTEARRQESEANIFAAELLMPSKLVTKFWDETKDIGELALRFQVSTQAMAIRLGGMGLDIES